MSGCRRSSWFILRTGAFFEPDLRDRLGIALAKAIAPVIAPLPEQAAGGRVASITTIQRYCDDPIPIASDRHSQNQVLRTMKARSPTPAPRALAAMRNGPHTHTLLPIASFDGTALEWQGLGGHSTSPTADGQRFDVEEARPRFPSRYSRGNDLAIRQTIVGAVLYRPVFVSIVWFPRYRDGSK